MVRATWFAGWMGAILLVLPFTSFAVIAMPIALSRLLAQSQTIVVGKAARSASFWQGGRIMSLVEFHVSQVLRGDLHAGDVISVLQQGGVVDNVGQQVHGLPQLQPNQLKIVHLRRTSTGEYTPVHAVAGYWELAEDCVGDDCPIRHSLAHPQDPTTLRSLQEQIHAHQAQP